MVSFVDFFDKTEDTGEIDEPSDETKCVCVRVCVCLSVCLPVCVYIC